MLTTAIPSWIAEIAQTWEKDDGLREIILQLQLKDDALPGYTFQHGRLKFQGKIEVGPDADLRRKFLTEFHNSPIGGHSGIRETFEMIHSFLWWPTLRHDVTTFVRECDVCQQQKHETLASPGLLQPLPVPETPWADISMDFIEALPKSEGNTVIWVVVDRLTKYGHFVALKHPFSASQLAQVFISHIYKLHGLPATIVSDRDKVFISLFWQSLFRIVETKLQMSTSPITLNQMARLRG